MFSLFRELRRTYESSKSLEIIYSTSMPSLVSTCDLITENKMENWLQPLHKTCYLQNSFLIQHPSPIVRSPETLTWFLLFPTPITPGFKVSLPSFPSIQNLPISRDDCSWNMRHVPFWPIIHPIVRVHVTYLHRFRNLTQHGIVSVCASNWHQERLSFTFMLLQTMSPQRWITQVSSCQPAHMLFPTCVCIVRCFALVGSFFAFSSTTDDPVRDALPVTVSLPESCADKAILPATVLLPKRVRRT